MKYGTIDSSGKVIAGKNIVICCDGTGNVIGTDHTNVVKLVRSIKKDVPGQCVFYDPGVGTEGAQGALTRVAKAITKILGLAIGTGIHDNIKEAYLYLMNHYEKGDRVFLFGFSRGAYTVCALAGILHKCGLLEKGNDNLVSLALHTYQNCAKDDIEAQNTTKLFKATFGKECKPYFLGIWDTVASVGWASNGNPFPSTSSPDVKHVRHAISIDERRIKFPVKLWEASEGQIVKEVWFPGVHSDVGGGYEESESGLSKIALEWMLYEAQNNKEEDGLEHPILIDEHKCLETLGIKKQLMKEKSHEVSATDLVLPRGYYEMVKNANPTGILHNSLSKFWVILDRLLALFSSKKFGAYRPIPQDAIIHESALLRRKKLGKEGYAPSNLETIIQSRLAHIEGWENDINDHYSYHPGYSNTAKDNGTQAPEWKSWVVERKMVDYDTKIIEMNYTAGDLT